MFFKRAYFKQSLLHKLKVNGFPVFTKGDYFIISNCIYRKYFVLDTVKYLHAYCVCLGIKIRLLSPCSARCVTKTVAVGQAEQAYSHLSLKL